jgi:hypothetical protein
MTSLHWSARTAVLWLALASIWCLSAPRPAAAQPLASSVHFATLPPGVPLPSGAQCASLISPEPETRPQNTPYNHVVPSAGQLALFHASIPRWSTTPASDFARVDGNYTGSTDMILRWAACKWGIDEDVVRAQAWAETGWKQGGPNPGDGGGDKRFTQADCIHDGFAALWDFQCPNCCYTSWGILQTKAYYEWGTWPMIKDSTAFNADYRYADQRACMNGDDATYFRGRLPHNGFPTYANSLGNSDLMVWGCVGKHFSGDWFDNDSLKYIKSVREYLATKPWLSLPASTADDGGAREILSTSR